MEQALMYVGRGAFWVFISFVLVGMALMVLSIITDNWSAPGNLLLLVIGVAAFYAIGRWIT